MEKRDLFEELETERLILRKIIDDDAEMLYKNIYNNFEHFKYYYQLPFKDFEEYKKLVEKYKDYYEEVKGSELMDVVSLMHSKTTKYIEVDQEKYNDIYNSILGNINYLTQYIII